MIKIHDIYTGVIPTGFFQGQSAIIIIVAGYIHDNKFNNAELEDAPVYPAKDIAQRVIELFYRDFNRKAFNIYITGGEPALWDFGEVIAYINQNYRFNISTLSTLHSTSRLTPLWIVKTAGVKYCDWFRDCEITLAPVSHSSMINPTVLDQALSIEMIVHNGHPKLWKCIDIRKKRCAKYLIPKLYDKNLVQYDKNIDEAISATIADNELRFQLDLDLYLPRSGA